MLIYLKGLICITSSIKFIFCSVKINDIWFLLRGLLWICTSYKCPWSIHTNIANDATDVALFGWRHYPSLFINIAPFYLWSKIIFISQMRSFLGCLDDTVLQLFLSGLVSNRTFLFRQNYFYCIYHANEGWPLKKNLVSISNVTIQPSRMWLDINVNNPNYINRLKNWGNFLLTKLLISSNFMLIYIVKSKFGLTCTKPLRIQSSVNPGIPFGWLPCGT